MTSERALAAVPPSELRPEPDDRTHVSEAARRAHAYLVRHGFRGYDPYDALGSPVLRAPLVRRVRAARLAAQQVVKRLPLNVRPLLGVRKGLNPVTLAWTGQACAYLAVSEQRGHELWRAHALWCAHELERLATPGCSGHCWGYDFDWETRRGTIPAFAPTIVATGIVGNALFEIHRLLGDDRALELCVSASRFLLDDLPSREEEGGGRSWSYSPLDRTRVVNAAAKGGRLLAQAHSATGEGELLDVARQTFRFVAASQRPDGSWPYAVADPRGWADNFHTGYVLDALLAYEELTGDDSFHATRERGWAFYRASFFAGDRVPKYYSDRLYPIDATSCAQSLVTLSTFGDVEAAARVARWTVEHMQNDDGSFAYQVTPLYTNRIVYARWSVAALLCGLARLAYALAPER